MLQLLGRLHPLLVHFPIAFLVGAALAECWRGKRTGPSEVGFVCLVIGAASAIVTAATGWLFAQNDPPGMAEILFRHRWTGVAVAVVASGTVWLVLRWRRSANPALALAARAGLFVSLGLVSYAAHLGGTMVYGEGFLLEALLGEEEKTTAEGAGDAERGAEKKEEEKRAPDGAGVVAVAAQDSEHALPVVEPLVTDPVAAPAEPAPEGAQAPPAASDAVDYLTQIRPIFAARCYECHGDKKRPKGKLKLSDLAAVLARDAEDALILPGDPAGSPLYQRIILPADDEDVMPAKGNPLTAEETERIRAWIEQGARWEEGGKAPEPEQTGRGRLVLSDVQKKTRDAALERLRRAGALAERVSQDNEEVEVNLAVSPERAGDVELALLSGLEPCLVSLELSRSLVSNAGLAQLAGFTRLRFMRLDHTAIGDAGLAHLAPLSELESLNLFHSAVTDAGLVNLTGLTRLRRLYLDETAVSDAGAERLAAALPDLVLVRGPLPSSGAAAQPATEAR